MELGHAENLCCTGQYLISTTHHTGALCIRSQNKFGMTKSVTIPPEDPYH